MCRTMATRGCRTAGGGQSRGGGGESAVVQEVGKQSIQGVV